MAYPIDPVNSSNYRLMVMRLEPQKLKDLKISGYLESFYLPQTIPDIIEQIGQKYGGGKFQIKIVDGTGKFVKSKTFEISGIPKIPSKNSLIDCNCPINQILMRGCQNPEHR